MLLALIQLGPIYALLTGAGFLVANTVMGNIVEPRYMGRGLGKHLLSYGISRAWEMDADRVWLHTCNLDGPHALANYQKRGFKVFKVEEEPMPERYA